MEAASCTLITEEQHELGAPTATSAVVLKLGTHDLVAGSLHSATTQGAGRALVVHEKYPTPGLLDETTENFERLVLEVFGAVKRFIDDRRATAGGQHTFMVYATMPICVAFALGAYLGFGTDFRLMHWDQGARAYVPAEIGEGP